MGYHAAPPTVPPHSWSRNRDGDSNGDFSRKRPRSSATALVPRGKRSSGEEEVHEGGDQKGGGRHGMSEFRSK